MYNLILEDLAVLEMQKAFEWYESQEPGLGFELIEKAESCFLDISNNPQYIITFLIKKEEYIWINSLIK